MIGRLASAFLLAVLASNAASATILFDRTGDYEIRYYGTWFGMPDWRACMAHRRFEAERDLPEEFLAFGSAWGGDLGIGGTVIAVLSTEHDLPDGAQLPVTVTVDERIVRELTAVGADNGDGYVIVIGHDPILLQAIRRGHRMRIDIAGGWTDYPLDGTFNALAFLEACRSRYGGGAIGAGAARTETVDRLPPWLVPRSN